MFSIPSARKQVLREKRFFVEQPAAADDPHVRAGLLQCGGAVLQRVVPVDLHPRRRARPIILLEQRRA
jgi:hypothetical protein